MYACRCLCQGWCARQRGWVALSTKCNPSRLSDPSARQVNAFVCEEVASVYGVTPVACRACHSSARLGPVESVALRYRKLSRYPNLWAREITMMKAVLPPTSSVFSSPTRSHPPTSLPMPKGFAQHSFATLHGSTPHVRSPESGVHPTCSTPDSCAVWNTATGGKNAERESTQQTSHAQAQG